MQNFIHIYKSSVIVLILLLTCKVNAQVTGAYNYPQEFIKSHTNHIFSDYIRTVEFRQKNIDNSYPVLNINDNNPLLLTFDNLESEVKNFQYIILLCNSDWEIADMNEFDYMEGFRINPIRKFETSMNTLIPYVHYTLQIPNNDIRLTKAGNYIIKVFIDNKDSLAFIRRFVVLNKQVSINAVAKKAINMEYSSTGQEIDFTIIDANSIINNPYQDLKVVILQNGRWDLTIDNLKPLYIKDDELIYDYDTENVFQAGNEFRYFNCKNTRFKSENIEQIAYQKPYFLFKLQNDEKRIFKQYFSNTDLNGDFQIDLENSNNPETEADYVYVYFSIPYEIPFIDGNVFVLGNFNAWDKTKNNLMVYNFDKKEYQLKLLLKQGYYNYIYGLLNNENKKIDSELFEGNHYQTENNYVILVYNYNQTFGFDELIGYKIVNSGKMNE